MKKVALVGSTGSIGRQVINVINRRKSEFSLVAAIANSSVKEFKQQVEKLKPAFAALTDNEAAKAIGNLPQGVRFYSGKEGAMRALEECGADVIFVACGGFEGLAYSLKAAQLNAVIALANKESLVCGGDLLAKIPCTIVPVDSEHSALWQCLNFKRNAPFSRLYITASGGAFRGKKWSGLENVTPQMALAHPTWSMGAKITVDSATLLNKGYEVIEAHHLYNAPYDKITAVIHPQSIVHSMVMFEDGAILAQLSRPTMELPIQLALTYPKRMDAGLENLDFTKAFSLDFEPLERRDYPLFGLALSCGEEGGVLPTALNAASEKAVHAFLNGQIKYTDIFTVCEKVVLSTANRAVGSYGQLEEVNGVSRRKAEQFIKEIR